MNKDAASKGQTDKDFASKPVAWQRRAWKDGEPWTSWYMADDEPTPQNMKFDGVYSYEYRPLSPSVREVDK